MFFILLLQLSLYSSLYCCIPPAPPTPIDVSVRLMNASSVRVAWRWSSLGPAPNCFNTTTVTYHPEGGGESSLQLSDPAATEATLTNLQCNTSYTITVVATAEKYKTENVAPFSTLQGSYTIFSYLEIHNIYVINYCRPCVCYYRSMEPLSICAISHFNISDMDDSLSHTAVPHLLQRDMWLKC